MLLVTVFVVVCCAIREWLARRRRARLLAEELRRERHRLATEMPYRPYTLQGLRQYDGSEDRPIALAAKGEGRVRSSNATLPLVIATHAPAAHASLIAHPWCSAVFNVSRGREFYGKGGCYEALAGRDASRMLAKGILVEETAGLTKP